MRDYGLHVLASSPGVFLGSVLSKAERAHFFVESMTPEAAIWSLPTHQEDPLGFRAPGGGPPPSYSGIVGI